jgi:hypothetical protein
MDISTQRRRRRLIPRLGSIVAVGALIAVAQPAAAASTLGAQAA